MPALLDEGCEGAPQKGVATLISGFEGVTVRKWQPLMASLIVCTASMASAVAADLVEKAEKTPEVKTFVAALQTAGLVDSLRQDGPYTIYAPSDSAFKNLPEDTRKALLDDKSELKKVLAYHVVKGKTLVSEVRPGKVETVEGSPLSVESDNGLVKVNGASVIQSDLNADNGVIHIIDHVLQPQQ